MVDLSPRLVVLAVHRSDVALGCMRPGSIQCFLLMDQQQRLQQALGFDADELEANRRGQLSDEQRRRLTRQNKSLIAIARVFGLLFTLAATAAISWGITSPDAISTDPRRSGINLGYALGGVMGFLALVSAFMGFGAGAPSGSVRHKEGTVTIEASPVAGEITLRVGNDPVQLLAEAAPAFVEGARYRVHTMDGRVISAEQLG